MDFVLGNDVVKNLILAIAAEVIIIVCIAPLRNTMLKHRVAAVGISFMIIFLYAINFTLPFNFTKESIITTDSNVIPDTDQALGDSKASANEGVKEGVPIGHTVQEAEAQTITEESTQAAVVEIYNSECRGFDFPSMISVNHSDELGKPHKIEFVNTGNTEWDFNAGFCLTIEVDGMPSFFLVPDSTQSLVVAPSESSCFTVYFDLEPMRPKDGEISYSFYMARANPSKEFFEQGTVIPFGEKKEISIQFID